MSNSIPAWRKIVGGVFYFLAAISAPGAVIALFRPPFDGYSITDLVVVAIFAGIGYAVSGKEGPQANKAK